MRGKVQLKHSEDYYLKVLLKETKIKEVMTASPVSIQVSDPFREVPKKFKAFGIRHLPVVDEKNRLVGLVSQRDLFRIHPPKKTLDGDLVYDDEMLDSVILRHVMVTSPFYMNKEDSLGEALDKIVEKKYGCIPIVDKDTVLCGILTQIDILKVAVQIYRE